MDIINEIDKLRVTYEREKREVKEALEGKIAYNKKNLSMIDSRDYAEDYIETYTQSLATLERIFNEWNNVQRVTKGINFYIDQYIKTLKNEPVPRGKVEEYFNDLVRKGRNAIISVQHSTSVEDDIAPQKVFCQCLVNLRYIAGNARRLIEETDIIPTSKERDSKKFRADLEEAKGKLRTLSDKDLPCYKQLVSMKENLQKNYANIEGKLIGKNFSNQGDVDYNFLMGFKQESVSRENSEFVKNVLGVSPNLLATTPVYFNPKTSRGALLVRANAKYFESEEFLNFMTNVYFSFASALPAKGLQFAGVEKTADAVIRSIESQVSSLLGKNYIFGENIATETDAIEKLIKDLMAEYTRRSNIYRSLDGVANMFEYNEASPDNKHSLILCCINKYPVGLTSVRSSTINDIKTLMEKGYEKGIIMMVCQANEQNYYSDATPIFSPDEVSVDYIDINGKEIKYNGKNISTDITIQGFRANKFFKDMSDSNRAISASMPLDKLIEEVDRLNLPRKPFTKAISVPIGNLNGEWFNIDFKTCSTTTFGLILGKSSSGKSSFIHTLLLSAGYYYAPDELQFYLIDFKDANTSPEFSNYMQKSDEKNLFIPHVRYLSIKSKLESALDLLNKIEIMVNERSKQMQRLKKGTPDINVYNSSAEVQSGKLPKIPQVFFIIDEYKTMLEGGANATGSDAMVIDKISSKLQNLMTRIRAYGIGIIFLGQEIASGIRGTAFNQISTRITFDMGDESALRKIYTFNDYEASKYYASRLIEKGNALVSTNGGFATDFVRMAYAGPTGGAQQLKIAEMIREKYKNNPASKFTQVEAGSEDVVPIEEINDYDSAGAYLDNEIDEGRYYLPLGVSSASSIKMSLGYSMSKKASNYIAYANESKLFNIERNAIFAFMEKEKRRGEIHFASTRNEMKKFLSPYSNVEEKINRRVNFISNKTEIARKLIELKHLYEERSYEAEEDDVDFEPIFMVLHDISWLTEADTNAIWLPQNMAERAPQKKIEVDQKEVEDVRDICRNKGLDNLSEQLNGLGFDFDVAVASTPATIEKKSEEKASEEAIFTLNEVKEALSILHKRGNQCGIFLLIGAIKKSTVNTFLDGDKDGICKDYMIYGSFDLYRNASRAEEDECCAYLLPSGSKIRLIDYDSEIYTGWWNKI